MLWSSRIKFISIGCCIIVIVKQFLNSLTVLADDTCSSCCQQCQEVVFQYCGTPDTYSINTLLSIDVSSVTRKCVREYRRGRGRRLLDTMLVWGGGGLSCADGCISFLGSIVLCITLPILFEARVVCAKQQGWLRTAVVWRRFMLHRVWAGLWAARVWVATERSLPSEFVGVERLKCEGRVGDTFDVPSCGRIWV